MDEFKLRNFPLYNTKEESDYCWFDYLRFIFGIFIVHTTGYTWLYYFDCSKSKYLANKCCVIRKHVNKNTRSQSELEFHSPTKHRLKITKIRIMFIIVRQFMENLYIGCFANTKACNYIRSNKKKPPLWNKKWANICRQQLLSLWILCNTVSYDSIELAHFHQHISKIYQFW